MKSRSSCVAVISLLAAGGLAVFSPLAAQTEEGQVVQRENARKEMAVRDAMQQVQAGRTHYAAKRYSDAVDCFRNALSVLPKGPGTVKKEAFIKLSLSDALIAKAIDYRSVGRYEEAVAFLEEARDLAPKNKRAVQELVRTQDPIRHNPALSPQHAGDVHEVQRLLTLANGYIDLGKYDEADATFDRVLRIDTTNRAARQGKERVSKLQEQYYASARRSARAAMLTEVDRQWEEQPSKEEAPVVTDENLPVAAGSEAESAADSGVADAISRMVMPHVVFDEASLDEVVTALQNQISRFESNGIRAARSINLVTNFGLQTSPAYKSLAERRVTLDLSDVSVKDVLDILCSQLGVKYYYTQVGVELTYTGRDFGPLVDRTFSVPPHFFDGADAGDSDEESDGMDDEGGKVRVGRVDPVKALKAMKVAFPEGSYARYSPSTRQLHVRNTAYNLDEIQELLSAPMDGEKLIVLNVIMAQVSQEDLEELGFDWMFSSALNNEIYSTGGKLLDPTTQLPVIGAGVSSGRDVGPFPRQSVTEGLRSNVRLMNSDSLDSLVSSGSAKKYYANAATKAPGFFSFRAAWKSADLGVIMRGLSQKKGCDLLSNPRTVFRAGSEEQIVFANVHEFFYPTNWDSPQIVTSTTTDADEEDREDDDDYYDDYDDNSGGTAMVTPAHPTDFVRFGMSEDSVGGIGPVLQVHKAELNADNTLVNLALTFTYNDFEGLVNWGTPMVQPQQIEDADGNMTVNEVELTPNYILMPVFKRYFANTEVSLVPGTVLVLGGLQEARNVKFEDKVPVLGDLPLVGRLFRSEGESNIRKMMMIFAKVDVVDPTGRDINTGVRPSQFTDGI